MIRSILLCTPLLLSMVAHTFSQTLDRKASTTQVLSTLKERCKLKLDSGSLEELATALHSKYQLHVFLDPRLQADTNSEDLRFSISPQNISLRSALLKILEPHEITIAIKYHSLIITSQDRAYEEYLRPAVYDLTDLLQVQRTKESDPLNPNMEFVDFDSMMNLIRMQIHPDSWPTGTGADFTPLELRGKRLLVIRQSESGHLAIETLLADLRTACNRDEDIEQRDKHRVAEPN